MGRKKIASRPPWQRLARIAVALLSCLLPGTSLASGNWVKDDAFLTTGKVTLDASGNGNASHYEVPWGQTGAHYASQTLSVGVGSTLRIKTEGVVRARWTWLSNDGELPPKTVVVKKSATASFSGPSVSATGTTSNGLGSPKVASPGAETMSGDAYEVKDGSSGTIEVTWPVSATVAATGSTSASTTGPVRINASGSATVTSVTIESNFAVKSGGLFNFLVGQQAD